MCGRGEVALNVVKGLIRTEGGGVGRLSSVPGRVFLCRVRHCCAGSFIFMPDPAESEVIWGRLTKREMGEGLITMGRGEGGRVEGEGHAERGGEVHGGQWGKVGTLERWTLEEPG